MSSMYLETPLERLHLDTELVHAVSEDPDKLRELARRSFKAIAFATHSDQALEGGNGELFDAARDAIAEINGTDDDGLRALTQEFFAIRESEEGRQRHEKSFTARLRDEHDRRVAENEALLACATAEKPRYKRAFIELGITLLRGVHSTYTPVSEEDMGLGAKPPTEPNFVLLDSTLKGRRLRLGQAAGTFDFYSKSLALRKDGSVKATGIDVDMATDQPFDRTMELTPDAAWEQPAGVSLLGMVERPHIDAPDDPIDWSEAPRRPALPRGAQLGKTQKLDWQPVSQAGWLRHLAPAVARKHAMEDKYLIVADAREQQVAILGLCRKLEI